MGYEKLADSKEDLEKLASSLRRRIERKASEKEALEVELSNVEAKLREVKP